MDGFAYNESELKHEKEFFSDTKDEFSENSEELAEEAACDGESCELPCEIPISSITFDEESEEAQDNSVHVNTGRILGFVFCFVSLSFYIFFGVQATKALPFEKIPQLLQNEVFSYLFLSEDTLQSVSDDTAEAEQSINITDQNQNESDNKIYPIKKTNLAVSAKNAFSINNQTGYSPRPSELIRTGTSLLHTSQIYEEYGNDAPVVLIIHTHGTEAYSENCESYDLNEPFRSNDISKNVVSVGKVMAEVFREAGINVIHDTEMYDLKSYKDSYTRSRAAIAEHLEKNPSITYVFDVHRDAIIQSDMTALCPVGSYEGDETAQIMIVAGTDQDGAEHEDWEKNLTLALQIQSVLTSTSDELARSINLRTSAFNQGLSDGSLLLEIGSCANTLTQAKRCAVLSALSISEVINGKEGELSASELLKKYASE